MRRLRKTGLALVLGLLLGALTSTSGCAALTGLTTGAFTGAVDAPAQVARHYHGEFDRNPIYYFFDVVFFVPVGIVFGPAAGFAKGLSIDVMWLVGKQQYGPVFGTYEEPSIWRPYTIHW
ncbi:MAG: hypothetical protein ACAI25_20150 [Planctomycetota bacterium]